MYVPFAIFGPWNVQKKDFQNFETDSYKMDTLMAIEHLKKLKSTFFLVFWQNVSKIGQIYATYVS